MRKPPANSQICPRCNLISPLTTNVCDCGYDFETMRGGHRGAKAGSMAQGVGAFLMCIATFGLLSLYGVTLFTAGLLMLTISVLRERARGRR